MKGKCEPALEAISLIDFLPSAQKTWPLCLAQQLYMLLCYAAIYRKNLASNSQEERTPRGLDLELPRSWCLLNMLFARNESHESNPYSLKVAQIRGESNWSFGKKPGLMTSYLYCWAIPELAEMSTYCGERIWEQKCQGNTSGKKRAGKGF